MMRLGGRVRSRGVFWVSWRSFQNPRGLGRGLGHRPPPRISPDLTLSPPVIKEAQPLSIKLVCRYISDEGMKMTNLEYHFTQAYE